VFRPRGGRRRSPLFSARERRIHKRLFQFQLAALMQAPCQLLQRLFQLSRPLLESAVASLVGRIFLRQLAPLRSRARHPQHAIQHRPRVMPGTATVVGPPLRPQHRLDNLPLFFGQLLASCHRRTRRQTEHPQNAPTRAPKCL
jgi:hypothetical protein